MVVKTPLRFQGFKKKTQLFHDGDPYHIETSLLINVTEESENQIVLATRKDRSGTNI